MFFWMKFGKNKLEVNKNKNLMKLKKVDDVYLPKGMSESSQKNFKQD